jgi:two-component system chemotaxis response regulator CheY
MRMIVERALRQLGLGLGLTEVLQAGNGGEALAALEAAAASNFPLDLILSDVHMPVMDGLHFLLERQLRNLAPGVPLVMITADATDPDLLWAIANGAQGFISKPFKLEQMQAIVGPLMMCPA